MPSDIYETISYVTVDGDEIILSADNLETLWETIGRSGFKSPEIRTESRVYANGVSRTLASILQAREVTLQMVIHGSTRANATAIYNNLVSRLLQTGAKEEWGKLVIRRVNGEYVYLNCIYTGGLNIAEVYPRTYQFELTFEAGDAYFYDLDETEQEPARLESLIYLSDTLYLGGWTLLDGLTSVTINNTGEMFYPVFEITGPAAVIRVKNEATGQTLAMDENFRLATGEKLTIDCRENRRAIILTENSEDTDITNRLSLSSSLVFPIKKGTNSLQFYYTDIDEENSSFRIKYRKRYYSI